MLSFNQTSALYSWLFCILCKLQFGKKLVFDLHLSLVHGKKVEIKTEENNDFSESELDKDTTTEDHGRNISYECEICKTCFKLKANLKKHVASVHEEKKSFKCDICDYSCPRKDKMKSHMASVHEGKKPFWGHKSNLNTHITSFYD